MGRQSPVFKKNGLAGEVRGAKPLSRLQIYSSKVRWTGSERAAIVAEKQPGRRWRGKPAEEKGLLRRAGDDAARRRRHLEFDDLQPGNVDAYGPRHVSVHPWHPPDLRRHVDLRFGIDDAAQRR